MGGVPGSWTPKKNPAWNGVYTIDVPGISDVIRLPPTDSVALRRERIKRMRTSHEPLPASMNWMPSAMHHIDTAEDLLYSLGYPALMLAKVIAPDLVPYVGWVLAVDQILEIPMAIVGTPMIGATGKKLSTYEIKAVIGGLSGKASFTSNIMAHSHWMHWGISAAKTLYRFTGYGLNLGPILAMLTDVFWGSIRALGGERIVMRGPPSDDPILKPAQFIATVPELCALMPSLSNDDIHTLTAAICLASDQVTPHVNAGADDSRDDPAANTRPPFYEVYNPATVEALNLEGFRTTSPSPPALPLNPERSTWSDNVLALQEHAAVWERDLAAALTNDPAGGAIAQALRATAQQNFDAATGVPGSIQPQLPWYIVILLRMVELNMWPHPRTTVPDMLAILTQIHDLLGSTGRFSDITPSLLTLVCGRQQGGWSSWIGTPPHRDWTFDQAQYGAWPMGCHTPYNIDTLNEWRKCIYFEDVDLLPDCQRITQAPPDQNHDPCPNKEQDPCTAAREALKGSGLSMDACGLHGDTWILIVERPYQYAKTTWEQAAWNAAAEKLLAAGWTGADLSPTLTQYIKQFGPAPGD
jgi:hypothetical protein